MVKKKNSDKRDDKATPDVIIEDNVVAEEKKAQDLSEIDEPKTPEHSISGQEVDLEDVESETQTEEGIAPEVLAINTDTETALEADKQSKPKKEKKPQKKEKNKATKPKIRSKKYQEKAEKLDHKVHSISEAIEVLKNSSYSKFDGTVSVAIRIERNKKTEDAIRGTIRLPHGTGKTQEVVIASDEIIEKIKKGWSDFDVLIASTEIMPRLGQVAKILGPKGKMPNPKDGTVVENPKDVVDDLSKMVVRYRADLGNNLHIPIGKVSWDKVKIEENLRVVLKTLARFKVSSITLSATMSPAVKVETKQS